MKYRYFRNNPRAYDKLSPRAEREKDSSPFFLSFSVQQFDKATSVSASKEIERDYWTVDWITGLLSRISFLPSFECKARRINFRVGRRFYSYEKLPEGGGKKRKGRGGKTCAVVEHPCSSFVLHPFLSHGISSKRGERERENSSPVKKSIYIYYPPTRLYLQIESTFIQSSPPRWKRKRQRVGKSGSVLTIDRIKSLSSRRAPLNLHEPSISTDEKPWSNEKRSKRKIGHNRRRGRRNGEDREDESVGYESRGQKKEWGGSGKHPRRKDERDLKNLDVRHYRCWIPFERTTSSSLLSLLMRPAFSFFPSLPPSWPWHSFLFFFFF